MAWRLIGTGSHVETAGERLAASERGSAVRASPQEATGASGQSAVSSKFQQIGWGVTDNPFHDLGTDLWLMARDARRFDLGLLVGAQVKTGASFFDEPIHGEVGELQGWWFRESTRDHFRYWLRHSAPHIIVLHDPATGVSYWAPITDETVVFTPKGGKVMVPATQVVGVESVDDLLTAATSQRPSPAWEGSAWKGAKQLLPEDSLRYALLTPRLVAPHPNQSVQSLQPDQALAMLIQMRIEDLERKGCRSAEDAMRSTAWAWQFFGAMLTCVESDELSPLLEVRASATHPHERAASAVAAAAFLRERGDIEAALGTIEAALGEDDASPVDDAWLKVQKARFLAEGGHAKNARGVAIELQKLRATAPHDATAMAIAAAAAELVFTTSGFASGDVQDVVTSTDTTAAWWRSQVVAWGLGAHFDESFKKWAEDPAITFGASDRAWSHLRSASLMAGFAGAHGEWRHNFSRLAARELQTEEGQSAEAVEESIAMMRSAGDEKHLKLAVRRTIEQGPAVAVQRVAHAIDLAKSTRTSVRADLALITTGADVVDALDADRFATWALQTLEMQGATPDLAGSNHRDAALQMLRALVPVVSGETKRRIISHVLALAPQDDQGVAKRYAAIIYALDEDEWTAEDISALLARPREDNWELADAIESVLARHDTEVRQALLDRARSGGFPALRSLGALPDVSGLPAEGVTAIIRDVGAQLRAQILQARTFSYGLGGPDLSHTLTLVNLSHPEQADWAPVVGLLNEVASHPEHLAGTLRTLTWTAHPLPDEVSAAMESALRAILQRGDNIALMMTRTDVRGSAAEALEALRPGALDDEDLWLLMAGSAAMRASAVNVVARRRDPAQFSFLAGQAHDAHPMIRATAARCLAMWAAEGIETTRASQLLARLLEDPGTRVAKAVSAAVLDATDPSGLGDIVGRLRAHVSALVRNRALIVEAKLRQAPTADADGPAASTLADSASAPTPSVK